jgi:arylsulfatase A-like enzyme
MARTGWIPTTLVWAALFSGEQTSASDLTAIDRAPESTEEKPGPFATLPITIILMDDLGYELLDLASTPNFDALVAGGLNFTRAWVCPVCSPTRAAILTGLYPTRTGMGTNMAWGEFGDHSLSLGHTTFAELLPEPVHAFGKWHVSYRHTDPNTQGFDHYAGSLFNLTGTGTGYYDWLQTVDGVTSNQTTYCTTATTDFAMNSAAGVRFIAYHAAHTPYDSPPGGTATKPLGKALEMVEFLDQDIGRLLQNYYGYVFILSDNGTAFRFGGGKGSLMESGIRVPFIVNGPGITPGTTDELIHGVDIFATLAEMRGVPHNSPDSLSFLSVMQGGKGLRSYNYSEFFKPNPDTTNRQWAICNKDYKLTNCYKFASKNNPISLFAMPAETYILGTDYNKKDRAAYADLLANLPF